MSNTKSLNNNNSKSASSKKDSQIIKKKSSKSNNSNSERVSKRSSGQYSSSKMDISKSSHQAISNKSKSSNSTLLDEIPLTYEELKAEIVNEIKRINGSNKSKYQQRGALNDTVGLIIADIQKFHKSLSKSNTENNKSEGGEEQEIENYEDEDITKNFLRKYAKEIQSIIRSEIIRHRISSDMKEKSVKAISQNYALMRQIQDLKNRQIKKEIKNKKMYLIELNKNNTYKEKCQDLFGKMLQLENEKYISDISNYEELRLKESEEYQKRAYEVDKYYTDKIAILQEILKREKRENKRDKNLKKMFIEKLTNSKRGKFKQQIDEVIERLDEEDDNDANVEENNNNQEEIQKILNNYYKK